MSNQSKQYILRAMAKNYADSGHSWDHLDSQVCTEAADEIDQLHATNQRLEGDLQTADTACFLSIVENKRLEGEVKRLQEALTATPSPDAELVELLSQCRGIVAKEVERWTRAASILPVNADIESSLLARIDAKLASLKGAP